MTVSPTVLPLPPFHTLDQQAWPVVAYRGRILEQLVLFATQGYVAAMGYLCVSWSQLEHPEAASCPLLRALKGLSLPTDTRHLFPAPLVLLLRSLIIRRYCCRPGRTAPVLRSSPTAAPRFHSDI